MIFAIFCKTYSSLLPLLPSVKRFPAPRSPLPTPRSPLPAPSSPLPAPRSPIPFFRELGWDVDNTAGYAEAYRDVIHEDQVKVGGAVKAPDYGFRIGGQRKFFLEAILVEQSP